MERKLNLEKKYPREVLVEDVSVREGTHYHTVRCFYPPVLPYPLEKKAAIPEGRVCNIENFSRERSKLIAFPPATI